MPRPTGASSITTHPDDALATLRDCLQRLRFGSIAIAAHDDGIVQRDITEKRRLTG